MKGYEALPPLSRNQAAQVLRTYFASYLKQLAESPAALSRLCKVGAWKQRASCFFFARYPGLLGFSDKHISHGQIFPYKA